MDGEAGLRHGSRGSHSQYVVLSKPTKNFRSVSWVHFFLSLSQTVSSRMSTFVRIQSSGYALLDITQSTVRFSSRSRQPTRLLLAVAAAGRTVRMRGAAAVPCRSLRRVFRM